ncbi:family 43 glycosylhydrolase [Curtobacterium sp. MCJR17_043]|uniref:family 43 glycosylhydrolase n=1 Tax=Curtobacterium sp. MCJR17_043 TaxID=2175660 RepID=UPI0024E00A73|nr:family 43 glycosylhydrolase [Curtobacterium sp. MCJR17_043]WIB37184.1 family 43 glycosylhydrolase [Curtobacterium sp. MCJR17_043]
MGVATSSSPTGPWTDSGGPVVAPQTAPNGDGFRWSFDPEVITDSGRTYLYFGSYFGGVHVRQLTADGLRSRPETERQIAIDNRYEGSYLMRHGGWWYYMGSATNCCNGSLTGYGVFVARSKSPLGPFRDRDGVAITDTRVGGSPLLAQNGNRWVGTGHNTVVTDFADQDWMIYHAVDRTDPYYAGQTGYTKRPALIDPIDWVGGWPVVRGGSRTLRLRGARPGGTARAALRVPAAPRPGRRPGADDPVTVHRVRRHRAAADAHVDPAAGQCHVRGLRRRLPLADPGRRPAPAADAARLGADRSGTRRGLRRGDPGADGHPGDR